MFERRLVRACFSIRIGTFLEEPFPRVEVAIGARHGSLDLVRQFFDGDVTEDGASRLVFALG